MNGGERVRSSSTEMQVIEPQPGIIYTLEAVVHLTGVSRHDILVYCRSGLVEPIDSEHGLSFDEESIYNIRRIEELRSIHGINLNGVRMIFELLHEVRRLREEMRFLR